MWWGPPIPGDPDPSNAQTSQRIIVVHHRASSADDDYWLFRQQGLPIRSHQHRLFEHQTGVTKLAAYWNQCQARVIAIVVEQEVDNEGI